MNENVIDSLKHLGYGMASGSPLSVVFLWALSQAGITVPAQVATAIGSLFVGVAGLLSYYFTNRSKRHVNTQSRPNPNPHDHSV